MFDSIINFFESINPSFGTFVISMIPVIELRGAIPAGIHAGLHWLWVYILCVVGNMLPIPFVIWIIRPLIEWLIHSKVFHKVGNWLDNRTKKKSASVLKYKKLGLLIFVAIPFPGTGAWSGATIAGMLNMRQKDALPVIFCGVLIAGAIVTLVSMGIFKIVL